MLKTYTPNTVSGDTKFEPKNTYYNSWVAEEELNDIRQLVYYGMSTMVMMTGCFKGEDGRLDKKKIDNHKKYIADLLKRIVLQCGW